MRIILVKDIRVGDTIVWPTFNVIMKMNYMTVEGIEEGEDYFSHYGADGIIVSLAEPDACLMLKGIVMSKLGAREGFDRGYPMKKDTSTEILLIHRIGEVRSGEE